MRNTFQGGNDRAEQSLRGAAYTRGSVLPARPDATPQAPPPTDPESAAGWLGTAIVTGVSGDYPATVRLAEQALAG